MKKVSNKPRCTVAQWRAERDGFGRFCKGRVPLMWKAEMNGLAGLGKTPHSAARRLAKTMERAKSDQWFLCPY